MITFLQAINKVLVRLRQGQLSTLTGASEYVQLVAEFVNEAKEEVEEAWTWNDLHTRITVSAVASTDTYSLTGAGDSFRITDVWNASGAYSLTGPINTADLNTLSLTGGNTYSGISFFGLAGNDSSGDPQIWLVPTPADSATLYVHGYAKQAYLDYTSDADTYIQVPWRPVVLGAHAKMVSERGEDGGASFDELDAKFRSALADAIALDISRNHKFTDWYVC